MQVQVLLLEYMDESGMHERRRKSGDCAVLEKVWMSVEIAFVST